MAAGQRLEGSVGLYDYPLRGPSLRSGNARYYSPLLARFISADSIVPDPANPQALNRYAYVLNNPLKYTDPSGHCPAPPKGFGPAICFALFIKPATVTAGPFTLHGDGRDFSRNSNPGASRVWVWISVDQAKHVVGVNPTGYVQRNGQIEWHAPSSQNKVEVNRSKGGEITVSYDLVLSGILEDVAPHINGSITFVPDKKAGGYVAYGERDGFPWAEAYYHDGKGKVQTIFQRQALRGDPDDLNAIEKQYGLLEKPGHWTRSKFFPGKQPQRDEMCIPDKPC